MKAEDYALPVAVGLGAFLLIRSLRNRSASAGLVPSTVTSPPTEGRTPSGGGGGSSSSGGGSSSSGSSTRQPDGAQLQRELNNFRLLIRDGALPSIKASLNWPNAPLVVDGVVGPNTQRVYEHYKTALDRARLGIWGFAEFSALPPLTSYNIRTGRASGAVREVAAAVGQSTQRRKALATLFGGR